MKGKRIKQVNYIDVVSHLERDVAGKMTDGRPLTVECRLLRRRLRRLYCTGDNARYLTWHRTNIWCFFCLRTSFLVSADERFTLCVRCYFHNNGVFL